MKINLIISGLTALVFMTSCKSLQSIASKDTSSSTKQNTVRPDRRDLKFMDNIEVTPGSVVTSKHTTINTRSPKKTAPVAQQQEISKTAPSTELSKANIEQADYLQLKYAVKLDATVEKLNNIPLLQAIDHWWGTPYHLGGTTESGIDCSAFTQTIMQTVYSVPLLRTAQEQYKNADPIELENLQEGDLIFFHTGGRRSREISHVGIYVLNNKFVHASTSSGVTISDLNDSYWKQHFKAAGRPKK